MPKHRFLQVLLALVVFSLIFANSFSGQTSMARITGVVMDPEQAVIPGANVLVRNEETGVEVRTQTNEAGVFVVPNLPPGRYTITVSSEGFRTYQRTGLVLETAQVL